MYQIQAKVTKIEPTETSGVVFVYFSNKDSELRLEIPEKINYFKIDDEVAIRFVESDNVEDDDRLFVLGYIFSNKIDEKDHRIVHISIGGLGFKLIFNNSDEIPILKPKRDIYIGFK